MLSQVFASVLLFTSSVAPPAQEGPTFYVGGAATRQEADDLSALLQATDAILSSAAFRENLVSLASDHPQIFLRMEGVDGSGVVNGTVEDLAQMTQSHAPFRFVRSPVSLFNMRSYFYAQAGVVGDDLNGSFALGRGNLGNWTSGNTVTQSCAVNTVAHEMSHLVSSDPTAFRYDTQPIRDFGAGRNSGTNAVGSYLIGTAAQCTWLQQSGHTPAVDFKTCVKVFGHRGFNGGRCTQFAAGQPVALRPDLFMEHVIQD